MSPMTLLNWPALVIAQMCITATAAVVTLIWLLEPIARRYGWPLWLPTAVGLSGLVALAPVRDVIGYGQVNLILLGLVAADMGWCVAKDRRYAGIGIGVAAAIKLVPGLFIVYLLLTKRYRAAVVAVSTFVTVTVAAAIIAPQDSLDFWLHRCWEVSRVGSPISAYNQSLQGGLLRMGVDSKHLWLVASVGVLMLWAYRVRALPEGSDRVGVALTGVTACLLSPITWVHHLVWMLPAVTVAVETGELLLIGIAGIILTGRITALWSDGGWFARAVPTNACMWLCLLFLSVLPIRTTSTRRSNQNMKKPISCSG